MTLPSPSGRRTPLKDRVLSFLAMSLPDDIVNELSGGPWRKGNIKTTLRAHPVTSLSDFLEGNRHLQKHLGQDEPADEAWGEYDDEGEAPKPKRPPGEKFLRACAYILDPDYDPETTRKAARYLERNGVKILRQDRKKITALREEQEARLETLQGDPQEMSRAIYEMKESCDMYGVSPDKITEEYMRKSLRGNIRVFGGVEAALTFAIRAFEEVILERGPGSPGR